jgi:hypothetical protein
MFFAVFRKHQIFFTVFRKFQIFFAVLCFFTTWGFKIDLPCNDLYVWIDSGEFEKSSKAFNGNVEVAVSVVLQDGTIVQVNRPTLWQIQRGCKIS